ncbi:hypothetical protein IHO40_02920 [Wolbachia endosymbiont of Mansonella ozzardi]|uniref:hypothetical protein n=1 Tax=Wolbachia endosymbiont of Mansonella ozzardi TaxID=137464 RepID=UPI001CE1ED0E|nr:hypothetical protein [Wolbachia endosymbiont of Mansonella ozzardi]MCA4775059.1 hypothetical protein [Wolbachia endosymbiont of Mansonella ozzardi]
MNLNQLKIDNSKKAVGVVNYIRHFVLFLAKSLLDITESQPVSSEEILGSGRGVSLSDQLSKKKVNQFLVKEFLVQVKELINQSKKYSKKSSTNGSRFYKVITDKEILLLINKNKKHDKKEYEKN